VTDGEGLVPPEAPGASRLVEWLGSWSAFHDFLLLSCPAQGHTDGTIQIRGWVTDPSAHDSEGHFVRRSHCLITLGLSAITRRSVAPETFPAIIFEFVVGREAGGWGVSWTSSYGAEGSFGCSLLTCDIVSAPANDDA